MTDHSMLSRPLALGLMLACTAAPALAEDDQTTPPWSMADEYYGEEAMARSRDAVLAANGAQSHSMIMADRFEVQSSDQEDTLLWDANIWYGGDINKLWIKTEGDFSLTENAIEEAEAASLMVTRNLDLFRPASRCALRFRPQRPHACRDWRSRPCPLLV